MFFNNSKISQYTAILTVFVLSLFTMGGCTLFEDNTTSSTSSPYLEFYQEKQNVYFEINANPSILDGKSAKELMTCTTWFINYPADKRFLYIQDTINLYLNKKGE